MSSSPRRNNQSLETILNFENRDASQWSVVWSTSHIPGMDNAIGGGPGRRLTGRRRLRVGSLALGAFLTMHCRVIASVMTSGFFVFIIFLIVAVAVLANPMRHFEVYLGQWSISGPGRAFRIIPIFDGIGIAICINAIVRAISCSTMAAIAAVYVSHSVADAKLPFTYCRDFKLKPYEPIMIDFTAFMSLKASPKLFQESFPISENNENEFTTQVTAIKEGPPFGYFFLGCLAAALASIKKIITSIYLGSVVMKGRIAEGTPTQKDPLKITPMIQKSVIFAKMYRDNKLKGERKSFIRRTSRRLAVCNESYAGSYPPLYKTPPYNFFYVEVVQLRSDYSLIHFNLNLIISIAIIWFMIWILIVMERLTYGKLIWNNVKSSLVIIPWIWSVLLVIIGITHVSLVPKSLRKVFRVGPKELLDAAGDALEVALYIHSASVGTELVLGKGLNHYASGHIDPHLNGENVWHSGLLLLVTAVHSTGAALCALVDHIQPTSKESFNIRESSLWIIPMYSKCTSLGGYTRFTSTFVFGGLLISYMAVAFVLIKTSLHTIFEYRVKLVFVEQVVVGLLILLCMGLSLIFATHGGIALLESVDAVMTGIAMPLICLLELVCMLYVYRSHDFVSDMNIATEENTCSSRLGTQWQIIPFVTLVTVIIKIIGLTKTELPIEFMWIASALLMIMVIAVPLRACRNAYVYLKLAPHRGA